MSVTARLGFVGLGQIGSLMARRLISAGNAVALYDVAPAAMNAFADGGCRCVGSLEEMGEAAEIVFLSLPSPSIVFDAVKEVATGAAGRAIVDLSTTGRSGSIDISRYLQERKIAFVEAPVSGGLAGARAGTLSLMVAGDERAVEAVQGPLSMLGKIFRVGH